ncbi:MAG: SMF family protein [Geobacteraceae bacterium GWC2_58_44]|nr:MAG: SMF family protein [Geobacteraceae bacterium GWC2_58_44]HBG04583.1 SMF family protein [Geobacter sp.]
MHSLGNLELLELYKVAFLCSRKYPEMAATRSCQWADEQREKGVCVISGYHSPIEKDVLRRLLQGTQPIIIALAKGLQKLDEEWSAPIEAGRLLVITRYADSVSHACESKCFQRNRLMVGLADEIVIAHASAGGNLERLCAECDLKKVSRL